MNNRVYLEMLEVCGRIDADTFNNDKDIIDDIKNTDISLKRMIEIPYKYKVNIFEVAYFALCRDMGKMLDTDYDKERSKNFLDKVCYRIERRYEIIGKRKITNFMSKIRKLIDISYDINIKYRDREQYLKYMKIEQLPDGASLNIDGKVYKMIRENSDSITFMLEHIDGKIEAENIGFITITKENEIRYVNESNLKIKESKIRTYIEDDDIDMIVILDEASNNFMINKIRNDYVVED